jgi:uroporphyrinogen-III synthase/uroporphyrinogen III methyltransferase/synthase
VPATAVITRDSVDAQAYASVLAPLGLDVVPMPVTRTVAPEDPDALVRALSATSYDLILVASPRAAHELARALPTQRPEIWAVGPATKRALDLAGLPAQMPPGPRDGVELAQHLIAAGKVTGKRILVPRAEEGRLDAIEMLRAAGAVVVDVVAYRTLAVDDTSIAQGRDLIANGSAAVCCVFAPSQVTALAAIVGPLGALKTRFCAIGETTAAALRSAGVSEVAVASSPTPEGMAQAVRSVYPP